MLFQQSDPRHLVCSVDACGADPSIAHEHTANFPHCPELSFSQIKPALPLTNILRTSVCTSPRSRKLPHFLTGPKPACSNYWCTHPRAHRGSYIQAQVRGCQISNSLCFPSRMFCCADCVSYLFRLSLRCYSCMASPTPFGPLWPPMASLEPFTPSLRLPGRPRVDRVDGRPQKQHEVPINCLAYADDLKVASASPKGLQQRHQQQYLEVARLQANPSKSSFLSVSAKGHVSKEHGFKLHDIPPPQIHMGDACRYLGTPDSLSSQQQRTHVAAIWCARKDVGIIFSSGLIAQQNLKACRASILSRFEYYLRHSLPLFQETKAFDIHIRKLVSSLLNFPKRVTTSSFHLLQQLGGLVLPSLQQGPYTHTRGWSARTMCSVR